MPTDLESFEVSIKAPKDLMLKLGDGKWGDGFRPWTVDFRSISSSGSPAMCWNHTLLMEMKAVLIHFDVFLAPWDNVTLALRRLANRFLEARNGSILGLKSQGTWKYLEMTSLVIMWLMPQSWQSHPKRKQASQVLAWNCQHEGGTIGSMSVSLAHHHFWEDPMIRVHIRNLCVSLLTLMGLRQKTKHATVGVNEQ